MSSFSDAEDPAAPAEMHAYSSWLTKGVS